MSGRNGKLDGSVEPMKGHREVRRVSGVEYAAVRIPVGQTGPMGGVRVRRQILLAVAPLTLAGCLTPVTSRLDRTNDQLLVANEQLARISAKLEESQQQLARSNAQVAQTDQRLAEANRA